MAISGIGDLAGLFNRIIDDAFFLARARSLMPQLVTNMSATGRADREMPRYSEPAAAQVVGELEDLSIARAFAKTTVTISPAETGDQILLTDAKMETDPDQAEADARTDLAYAIRRKVEEDLVGLFSGFTTDKGAGSGTTATFSSYAAAFAVLINNKAPGRVFAVNHPYHWHDIWVELGQPSANQAFLGEVANEALREYFVSAISGMLWFINPFIIPDATPDAVSGVFVRPALAFDMRRAPRIEPERDASLRAWELNATMVYAFGERVDTYGIGMTADATEPT
ncbi:MAG: hypothetical protein GTO63_27345 [Anaerolineae bacterium]|nr:hypothetical protein [Anaerolineae bacterium]NIN98443.1 hypothetical protein [Anaerolineae bacterium]